MNTPATTLLRHPIVLSATLLWLVNDHVFKHVCPSWWTGKLSDVASMVVFPVVLSATLECAGWRHRRTLGVAALGTALLFVAIQLSAPAADLYVQLFGALHWVLGGMRGLPGVVAHTSDPTDCIVAPLAAIPVWLAHHERLPTGVALAAAMLWFVTPATAQATPLTVSSVDVFGGVAVDSDPTPFLLPPIFVQDEWGRARYGLVGAEGAWRAQATRRTSLGMSLGHTEGWLLDATDVHQRFGVVAARYRLTTVGALGVTSLSRVEIRYGLHLLVGSTQDDRLVIPTGFVRFRWFARRLRGVALVWGGGPPSPVAQFDMLHFGVAYEGRRGGRVSLIGTMAARMQPGIAGRTDLYSGFELAGYFGGGWLEVRAPLANGRQLRFDLRAGARHAIASVGVSWAPRGRPGHRADGAAGEPHRAVARGLSGER